MQSLPINLKTAFARLGRCCLTLAITFTLVQVRPNDAAAQNEPALRRTIRSHWVRPNADGAVEGRISALEMNSTVPIEQLEVSLMKSGNKLHTETTDAEGKFSFSDVTPDVYTLIAAGKNGFMAYGIEVVPRPEDTILDPGFSNRAAAEEEYYTSLGLPSGAIVQDDLQIDAAAIPPTFSTMERLTQTFLPNSGIFAGDMKAIGKAEEVSGGFQYELSGDGSFLGKLQPINTDGGGNQSLSEMNIFLIQDDVEVGRVPVEENGNFELKDVEPGIYAIVAAGKDGFAALSMQLVAGGSENAVAPTQGFLNISAKRKQEFPAIGIAFVSDPEDIKVIQQEVQRIANLNRPAGDNFAGQNAFDQAPMASDPGGGSFGGSPAAPSGFSPANSFPSGGSPSVGPGPSFRGPSVNPAFRRLIAIGAIGGGIIAISTNNDEPSSNPLPISPNTTSSN